MKSKYYLTLSCAILLSGCACNKKEWSLYTYHKTSHEGRMFVCESLLKDESSNGEKYDVAYKRANALLKSEQETKTRKCEVVNNSLNFDPRGPQAVMDVKCEQKLIGNDLEGLSWFIVIDSKIPSIE